MSEDIKRIPEPVGFTPDGIPVYVQFARGSSKSMLTLEVYRKLCGISDDEWGDMKAEVMKRFGFLDD